MNNAVGKVVSVVDGVAEIQGLGSVFFNEVIDFELPFGKKALGLVMSSNEETVKALVLNNEDAVVANTMVSRTRELVRIPVGKGLLGRVIDPLGNPLDSKGDIQFFARNPVESNSPDTNIRGLIHEPMVTGNKIIDLLIPIGRGQNQIIMGDKFTGKSTLAIDAIINQKNFNYTENDYDKIYCIYVAIGQKPSKISMLINKLEETGAIAYTTVIAVSDADNSAYTIFSPICRLYDRRIF